MSKSEDIIILQLSNKMHQPLAEWYVYSRLLRSHWPSFNHKMGLWISHHCCSKKRDGNSPQKHSNWINTTGDRKIGVLDIEVNCSFKVITYTWAVPFASCQNVTCHVQGSCLQFGCLCLAQEACWKERIEPVTFSVLAAKSTDDLFSLSFTWNRESHLSENPFIVFWLSNSSFLLLQLLWKTSYQNTFTLKLPPLCVCSALLTKSHVIFYVQYSRIMLQSAWLNQFFHLSTMFLNTAENLIWSFQCFAEGHIFDTDSKKKKQKKTLFIYMFFE